MQPEEWTRKAFLRALKALPSDSDPVVHRYWINWVRDYHIGRKEKVEIASKIYNRVQQPSWILWLAEAVGVDKRAILKASEIPPQKDKETQTFKMRKFLPWKRITVAALR